MVLCSAHAQSTLRHQTKTQTGSHSVHYQSERALGLPSRGLPCPPNVLCISALCKDASPPMPKQARALGTPYHLPSGTLDRPGTPTPSSAHISAFPRATSQTKASFLLAASWPTPAGAESPLTSGPQPPASQLPACALFRPQQLGPASPHTLVSLGPMGL